MYRLETGNPYRQLQTSGMSTRPYRIGMIGLGTVGSGVLKILRHQESVLTRRLGRPVEVARIAVRDPLKSRPHVGDFASVSKKLSGDPQAIIEDPEIDLLVEVAGGIDGPRGWIVGALSHGKDVVTANKAVLAIHGEEIFRQAIASDRRVYYEASVAAAIPIIEMLQNGLVANEITRLSAILNGTCNFILTQIETEGLDYETALKLAQEKGFAETDPTLDVSGADAAHKLALLAGIITGSHVPIDCVYAEGIEKISAKDFEYAGLFRYAIKLLGIIRRREEGPWELRVHPALIPRDDILAGVRNEYNAVSLRGDAIGKMTVFGKGAGSLPTASSVVADILRAARGEKEGGNPRGMKPPDLVPIGEITLKHYIRLEVLDYPGVLGRITSFFGMRGISIASIQQPEAKIGMPVPIVLLTHLCKDEVVTSTLRELEEANLVHGGFTRIRIEE